MVWIRSVRCKNVLQDILARTFALIAPVWRVLHQVSCSSETVPKCTRMERNTPKHEFRVQWCGSWAFVVKNWTFTLIAQVWRVLHQVSISSETVTNAPKRKETHQNMSLGTNGVDRERSLRKILARHRAWTFALIAPVWRFCTKFCAERNTPEHEFRFQCCGSGVFVVKISNKTSWHELLH